MAGISDPIKESSKSAVAALKASGIETFIITGDHEITAKAIAREVGIDSVYAQVQPTEKAGIIKDNTPVVIGQTQEETAPVFIKSESRCGSLGTVMPCSRFNSYVLEVHVDEIKKTINKINKLLI